MLVTSMSVALFVALLVAYSIAYWRGVRTYNRLMGVSAELAETRERFKTCEEYKNNAYAEINSLKTTIQRLNDQVSAFQYAEPVALAEATGRYDHALAALKEELRSHGEDLKTALAEITHRDERILTGEGELQKIQMAYDDALDGKKVAERKLIETTNELVASEGHLLRAKELQTTVQRTADLLRVREARLADAILAHRNARGHKRCRLNDQALYQAYDPTLPEIEPCGGESLPELVAGCTAYWLGQLGHPEMVPGKMEVDKEEVMS